MTFAAPTTASSARIERRMAIAPSVSAVARERGHTLRHVGAVRLFVACDAPPGDAILNQRELGKFAQVMLKIARIPVVSSAANPDAPKRSEERRVGKECRCRWAPNE